MCGTLKSTHVTMMMKHFLSGSYDFPQATVVDEIQSTIIGMVFDENNVPVADATVLTYNTQTKTNEKGIFVIRNARMDKQGTYIKIIKSGYILGSDFVYHRRMLSLILIQNCWLLRNQNL